MANCTFRAAVPGDEALILDFIRQLAVYERMEDQVVATPELLTEWIFEKQKAEVVFAEADGQPVGFTLFFHNFSTFLGRAGIYLEDLFVLPEHRGKGYAQQAIMVGDREEDVASGKANGCITVAIQNDFGARDAIGADYDVYSHVEMEQTILRILEEREQ